MEQETTDRMAVLITSDGRRINLDTREETYLLQALECNGKTGWMVDAFDGFIYRLLTGRQRGRRTRDDVMFELKEFESQWQTLLESIDQTKKKYPALVEQSLADAQASS